MLGASSARTGPPRSRGSPWRKSCPNLTLIPLPLSWTAGAPCASRPSGPQSLQSQRSRSSGLGLQAGEGPNSNCCHLLSAPPFPHGPAGRPGPATAFFRCLVGDQSSPPPSRAPVSQALPHRVKSGGDGVISPRFPHQLALRCDCLRSGMHRRVSVGRIGVERPRLRLEALGGGTELDTRRLAFPHLGTRVSVP